MRKPRLDARVSRLATVAGVLAVFLATPARSEDFPPSGGGPGSQDGGSTFVHVRSTNDDLIAKLGAVAPRGALILHANPRQASSAGSPITTYRLSRALRINKPVTIMAAPMDQGYVRLQFPSDTGCLEIGPSPRRWRHQHQADSFADDPQPNEEEDIEDPGEEEESPPQGGEEAKYFDGEMCQPAKKAGRPPTPYNTVALCGLRISRIASTYNPAIPACISVYRRQLYMANTKVEAGWGSGLDVWNSRSSGNSPSGVRMGTAEPGGIDRSVMFSGQGFAASKGEDTDTFGIRIDRKSESLLQWTEITGFGNAIQTDGHLDMQRGVQLHDNRVGILINGGQEDADIFGPRNITIGVNEEVAGEKVPGNDPSKRHDEPDLRAPQIEDNKIGIQVGRNFEGNIEIRSAQISSRYREDEPVGLWVEESKYKRFIVTLKGSVAPIFFEDLETAIHAAAPMTIGPNVIFNGNKFDVDFHPTYPTPRTGTPPFIIDNVTFDQAKPPKDKELPERVAMQFSGYFGNELGLCNMNWPRIGTRWDSINRVRVRSEGIRLIVKSGGFAKCYVDDLNGLRASLTKQDRNYFDQVCKGEILPCSSRPR